MLNYHKHNLWMAFVDFLFDNDEKVASSLNHTHIKARVQKPYLIYDQNGQNQLKLIPFLWPTQRKNHTLWGNTYLIYSRYKGVPPREWGFAYKKWSLGANWHIAAGAYPGFSSMKRLGVFLLHLDWMLVHRRSVPAINSIQCLNQVMPKSGHFFNFIYGNYVNEMQFHYNGHLINALEN